MPPRSVCLAPIRGVTDAVFRNTLARRFGGLERSVAPFVREGAGGAVPPAALRDVLPEHNPSLPVEPQALTRDPERFLALARAVADLGHESLSWNLGCPSPRALSRGQGAGLLGAPEVVEHFLEAVSPRLPCRLSIKARLGVDDERELSRLLPLLARYPVAELVIHPRTVRDGFEAPLRLDPFEACLEASAAPVVWSGEITTAGRFDEVARRLPSVSAWMVGRGAIADPWLPARIVRGDGVAPSFDQLAPFLADLLEGWRQQLSGPSPVLARLVGLWSYLAPSVDGGRKVLKAARKARTLDRYEAALARCLDSGPRWIGPADRPLPVRGSSTARSAG